MAPFRAFVFIVFLVPLTVAGQTPAPSDSSSVKPRTPDTTRLAPAHPDSMMQGALPELRVIEPRATAPLTTPTALTSLDLQSGARAGRSAADVLAERTSLFLKQYGPAGLATASLRGLGSAQTLVLVDGHRLADPQTGQADLSLVPSLLLESAHILHGSHGARYGSGTLGGVIQLETVHPSSPLRVDVMGGLGAYGWHTASALFSSAGEHWSGLFAAESSGWHGRFSYSNAALIPQRTERRKNAHRQHRTTFGKVSREGTNGRSTASVWWNHVDRGLPGPANVSTSDASQTDTQWRLTGRHQHSLPSGDLQVEIRGQHSSLQYHNPASSRTRSRSDTSRTYRATLDVSTHLAIAPNLLLTSGATGGYDWAGVRRGVYRWRAGAFADVTWSKGPVTLSPALRLDAHRPSNGSRAVTALSPQLGLIWTPGPSWFRLKGHVGRSFRAPTFNERFFVPGGNPNLRSESGWSAEAGAAVQMDRPTVVAQTEATLFTTRLDNRIVWQPSYVGPGLQVWRPSNLSDVHTRGIEWSTRGRWHVRPHLHLDGRATFSHVIATDQSVPAARSFGKQLPYTPRQRLKVKIGLEWSPLRLDASTRLVGRRYVTADETQALPPYQVTNLGVRIRQSVGPASITARVEIRNLLNEDYSVVRLYPMPPRHARARLAISLP